ncbi:SAYSvFN domain-containing protein 1 [Halocaridina rubra]|uniref:SAYSvFN domain-containing protein 1 n=1 Tax=Halocaridina rubra TaxID=373956 RepID=A0AAN8X109_HALRR
MEKPGKPNIQEQLAQYRARKKKEEQYGSLRQRVWNMVTWRASEESSDSGNIPESERDIGDADLQETKRRTVFPRDSSIKAENNTFTTQVQSEPSFIESYTTLDWIALVLKCLMWMLLWKVFILLEFGAVYFIFSAFVFIWYNMRSGPKRKGEISAYSVFNPNCEVIEGTFTAEQFERELLHKM